ncbi:lipopolysaccharide biosynthesis protein [Devosia sediminis]|uniref:Oligosaccharide flippase family protein n=1 Tax=Devosia sediminis TaxID=2798801 RepID=A0A934MMU4_9HYPH|nr:oligosaccharide flippase family protein [Devosia sediminis]MBJ3786570.1 oligosaccharide flippase family protein [Devosia sediminis]
MRISIPSDLSGLLQAGLLRSVGSLGIKVATAGLTYLTYVVLSRTQTVDEYGHFAFGLSLATVLAILAGSGQPLAILRLWAERRSKGDASGASEALAAGSGLTIGASLLIAALLCFGTLASLPFLVPGVTAMHFIGAAFLILPLALAEYNSSALRAQGSLWTALLPRDIFWRLALPALVLALFAVGIVLSGPDALTLAAGLLLGVLALQMWMATRHGYVILPALAPIRAHWQRWGNLSKWLLLGALIETFTLNADVILVGLMLDLESSGLYFNAFRTAGLMTLFTFAIELVIAPMVAEHFHAGNMRKAQAITALCSWAGFVFSLGIFAGFGLFGTEILGLFGPSYADGWLILMLLSFGLLFDAVTGPSKIVMMMTGHERAYVGIFGGIMALGFLLQILVIPVWGLVGAAAVNMGSRVVAQLGIALWCRHRIGLDTSLIGLFAVRRLTDAPAT